MSFGYDTSLDYDYEDTPRFMAQQEMEREKAIEKLDEELKNEPGV